MNSLAAYDIASFIAFFVPEGALEVLFVGAIIPIRKKIWEKKTNLKSTKKKAHKLKEVEACEPNEKKGVCVNYEWKRCSLLHNSDYIT